MLLCKLKEKKRKQKEKQTKKKQNKTKQNNNNNKKKRKQKQNKTKKNQKKTKNKQTNKQNINNKAKCFCGLNHTFYFTVSTESDLPRGTAFTFQVRGHNWVLFPMDFLTGLSVLLPWMQTSLS